MAELTSAQETAKALQSYLRDGRCSEDELTAVLREVRSDPVALRRYLVDAGLLDRTRSRYWRIGGQVNV